MPVISSLTTTQIQGLSTTTVVTLDLEGSLEQLDSDSVVADAGTIYASTDRLVIANRGGWAAGVIGLPKRAMDFYGARTPH